MATRISLVHLNVWGFATNGLDKNAKRSKRLQTLTKHHTKRVYTYKCIRK